jgi:hypothetical protein
VQGTTRAQPVVGCEMRMRGNRKKEWMGKKWEIHNKTRGKKLNQHAQSSKINENKKKSQCLKKISHFLNLPIENFKFLKIATISTRKKLF